VSVRQNVEKDNALYSDKAIHENSR